MRRTKTEVNYATNGIGPAAATAEPVLTAEEVEGYADACDVGHLEACAAQRITDSQDGGAGAGPSVSAAAAAPDTPRGTPYSNPGGKWSKFQKYSTFQVTFDVLCKMLVGIVGCWIAHVTHSCSLCSHIARHRSCHYSAPLF